MKIIRLTQLALIFAPIFTLMTITGCSSSEPLELRIPDGPLVGETDGETRVFLGVPFAEPPLGALRFAPPTPPAPWTSPREATESAPRCAQLDSDDPSRVNEDSSEDCLYLNIWAPEGKGPFPVLLFIPGGGYLHGGNDEPLYDGAHLSKMGEQIVIVANYRLGPFGFLAHEEMIAEHGPKSANLGLLDQRAALEWIHRNIAAFAGDPENITLAGNSSGAGSVCFHLVSSDSQSLFRRAIMQSPICSGVPHPSLAHSLSRRDDLASALGCADLSCIRERSSEDILKALPNKERYFVGEGVNWLPIIDGEFLTESPAELLRAGAAESIPILTGSTEDEGTYFIEEGSIRDHDELFELVADAFGSDEAAELLAYHAGDNKSPERIATDIISDLFTCDARRLARAHQEAGGRVYHYHFTRADFDLFAGLGAYHSAEMVYLFNTPIYGFRISPVGFPLARAIQRYFSGFIRTGTPTGAEPAWPAYSAASPQSMRLDLELSIAEDVRRERCDFMDIIMRGSGFTYNGGD